jgi:predicted HTH transcriptional regulator
MANSEKKEMTMREFLSAVAESDLSAEVIDKAKAEIVKLDERNAKRKGENSKRAKENEPIKSAIVDYLKENGKSVASVIGLAIGQSTNKVSALCKQMVEAGVLKKEDYKEKGKSAVNAYSLAE